MTRLPDLDNKAWCGLATAYGAAFIMEMKPSKQHPGHWHFAIACLADNFFNSTHKPVREDGLEGYVEYALKEHGLSFADVTWTELKGEPVLADQEN